MLYYSEEDAFDLWWMLRHRSLLPYAGGILDQPQVWRRDMRTMNGRYNRIVRRLIEENPPEGRNKRRSKDSDSSEDYDDPLEGDDPLKRHFGKRNRNDDVGDLFD